jgi:hypothetical protein
MFLPTAAIFLFAYGPCSSWQSTDYEKEQQQQESVIAFASPPDAFLRF